jgi:hypothetical protein
LRIWATTGASWAGVQFANSGEPKVVRTSSVSMLSFTTTGTQAAIASTPRVARSSSRNRCSTNTFPWAVLT